MMIAAGSRLGSYEILSPLGVGGMGEVWRARDDKLGRDVAIKVLPAAFAADAERLARFRREAQVLASLNHPHIAAIHGLEDFGGVEALVLELVEGETLAERIAEGALPIDEAFAIARQIAEALEAAHEKGIVHRDLKPANVKLTPEGQVKVLDFGLAKALSADASSPDISTSPTLTAAATQAGVVIGTAAYMSPEQARGKQVDKRADVWAFGAVLYEMLTGRRAFDGETVSDILAAVLTRDPDWAALPPGNPETVRRLLARCLERDRNRRLHDVADARIEIEEAIADRRNGSSLSGAAAPSGRSSSLRPIAYAAAFVVGLSLAFLAGSRLMGARAPRPSVPAAPIHSVIPLPAGTRLSGWASPVLALSRDGRKLAFVADKDGEPQQLYVHHLDRGDAQLVPDSETAEGPVFSPDGQWVAFAVNVSSQSTGALAGQLRKFSLSTGLTQPVCNILDYNGASWADDGSIVFVAEQPVPLSRVSASGGRTVSTDKVRAGGKNGPRTLYWPQLLPGDRSALVIDADASAWGNAAVLDLASGELSDLGVSSSFARYVATSHILLLQPNGTVMAAPFDAARRRIAGAPVAVLKDTAVSGNAAAVLAVSDTGSLVYASGYLRNSGRELLRLVRIGRKGEIENLPFEADTFGRWARPSPDGHRLAVPGWDGSRWIYDLERGSRTRMSSGKLSNADYMTWTPRGDRIAFMAFREGEVGYGIFWQKADGTGEPEALGTSGSEKHPLSWTPDGRSLLYMSRGPEAERGLWIQPVDPAGPPKRLLAGSIWEADLSPDGHWLAYDSAESGTLEVYVDKFPELGQKKQISSGGGRGPRWSRNGREIFYHAADRFFAVRIEAAGGLNRSLPEPLFQNSNIRGYDAAPDGNGFIAVYRPPDSGIIRELHLVSQWFEELTRLAPTEKK